MDLENFPTRETAKDMLSMISPIYDRSYVGKWIFQHRSGHRSGVSCSACLLQFPL